MDFNIESGFGSTKNIPTNYYKDAAVDVTKHGVVERRLMLPTTEECSVENQKLLEDNGFELKEGYIQVKGLSEDQYKEGIATDEDIYPKNLIKTDKITSYEKEVEDDSTTEEGDYIKRTFYRVENLTIVNEDGEKTGDMAFREAYKLSGQNLHIVFQSGSLSGLDFECEFNPDGVSEVIIDENGKPILVNGKEQINPESQVFEIILNEDYGRPLPDNILKPKAGDTFVLYNWDASKLGKTLVVAASNELLKSVVKSVKKSMIDPTTFTCTADSNYSFNNGNGRFHSLGDRIRLLVKSLDNKVRESRIIGFEMHLDIPFDSVKYIVGEKPSYSRFASLDSKIEELEMNGNTYQGKGGSGSTIYIIKSYDRVLPTDYNVYSAKAVNEQRLNKLKDDTAQGFITFLKGLKAQDVIKAINGFKLGNGDDFSIDGAGRAVLSEVAISLLKSLNYNNAEQTGFAIEQKNGKYQMSITDLVVWGKAIFNTLQLRELSYVGGNIVLSPSASKLTHVVEIRNADGEITGWKCYLLADDGSTATINSWKVDDQARCQTFNIKPGIYENVGNKDYWRRVTEVSQDNEVITDDNGHELYDGNKFAWIILSKTDCSDGADAVVTKNNSPAAGDSLVLIGNRTDKSRQNMLLMETEGSEAPRFVMYRGINNYSLANRSIVSVSYNGIDIRTGYIHYLSPTGDSIWTPCYRGTWKEGTEYSYYDEVTWLGTRWLCIVPEGDTTLTEPSEDNDYWRATTAVMKLQLRLYHNLSAGIARGETHNVQCRLELGDMDYTAAVKAWQVTRSTGDKTSDDAWALQDKVKNFKGSLDIAWSNDDSVDDLGTSDMATFTFAAQTTTGDVYKQMLEI